MKCTVGLTLVLGLVAAPALAQELEMAGPAPELEKFEGLIGDWTGTGVFRSAGDAEGKPWTATSTYKRILGGHAVQEDTVVDLGEGFPLPLQMRSLYAWSTESKQYMNFAMSSFGDFVSQEAHWLPDGSLVTVRETTEPDGTPLIERYLTQITDEGVTLKIEHVKGSGDVFTHVEGLFTKAEGPTKAIAEASASVVPPSQAIQRLSPMIGEFELAGEAVMFPGSDPMPVTGRETLTYAFGGHVIAAHIEGDTMAGSDFKYEGFGYIAWNERKRCYDSFSIDNMGMSGTTEGRFEGKDSLVFTHAGTFMGKPLVERLVLTFGEDGLAGVTTDRMTATNATERTFKASYTRKK